MAIKEKIYDVASDKETLIEMNKKELSDYEAEKVAAKSRQIELLAQAEAKAAAKAAAQAKLASLGLTIEDLTALGL